jgi:hypothetical protein
VNGDDGALRESNTASFSDGALLDRNDPRWIIAAQLQLRIQNHLVRHPLRNIESEHSSMVEQCVRSGFAPIHSEAIVQSVERACARGGLDERAMVELLDVPMPRREMRTNHRAILIALLGAWTIVIAGFVVTASRMMTVV